MTSDMTEVDARAATAWEPKKYISPIAAKSKNQAFWPSRIPETGHFLQVGSKVRSLKKKRLVSVGQVLSERLSTGKQWRAGGP
jgi:hypothetical protein